MNINRVNGVLGVSRSFGDIMYKNYAPEEKSPTSIHEHDVTNVWQPHYQVISLPEVNYKTMFLFIN